MLRRLRKGIRLAIKPDGSDDSDSEFSGSTHSFDYDEPCPSVVSPAVNPEYGSINLLDLEVSSKVEIRTSHKFKHPDELLWFLYNFDRDYPGTSRRRAIWWYILLTSLNGIKAVSGGYLTTLKRGMRIPFRGPLEWYTGDVLSMEEDWTYDGIDATWRIVIEASPTNCPLPIRRLKFQRELSATLTEFKVKNEVEDGSCVLVLDG